MGVKGRKPQARIVEKKGLPRVCIEFMDGTKDWPEQLPNGKIIYNRPERIPRYLKHTVVPDMFEQINLHLRGVKTLHFQ